MLTQKYSYMPKEMVNLVEKWFAEDNIQPIDNEWMLLAYSMMKKSNKAECDTVNDEGLLICGKCNTPKQKMVCMEVFQGTVKTSCLCACETERYLESEDSRLRSEFYDSMERWYGDVQIIKRGKKLSFGDDNKNNPLATARCREFTSKWETKANTPCGLLLYGNVGTGKSFLAECMKNTLIEKRVSALMTNIQMLNAGMGQYKESKVDVLHKVANVGLLILDDFGAEDDKMKSLMFEIIDTRCNAERPLVITTNLSLSAFNNPGNDIQKRRIYDRVLSMCTPIEFNGVSQRRRYDT